MGVGTVGSSEAIMLAGLAFKRRWQNKMKEAGKPCDKPNIVTGANVQVCWEKFARYFEVELKEVKLSDGYFVMDPDKAVEMVDENTICVAAILGSTLNGEFEDVKRLNDLLVEKKTKKQASGGFIAPFLYPELEWDFRLPLVKCINVSGHKYGLVYAGIGWVIWRSKEDLPEELIFHINYLGADQPTFTLNFSKDMLRRFGWIVPAYTMPPDAQHVTVLRVVVERLFKTLAERLVIDMGKFFTS
ncbi:Glutamate decarboxylase [Sesamum alatum]|uniref:glutamate decarboxylase n=1 Tax=Sesamum alatum TaxID=300844 RepID=A0AAE2CCB3_9LAMI|nr:Glutamate decarboxylase [Sesamum alatum]